MSAQITAGPWTVSPRGDGWHITAGGEGTGQRFENIALVHGMRGDNAKAIGALPDLLALAHQYADECGDCAGARVEPDGTPCTACEDIWEAIDKAEGRS